MKGDGLEMNKKCININIVNYYKMLNKLLKVFVK